MDRATFDRFRKLIYDRSGITLHEGKVSLVTSRIGKRMRALSIEEYGSYLDLVTKDQTGGEIVHLLDAISTNVTSFYREANHFDFLAQTMVKWAKQGQRRFRLWCAAASTGEEPYTILITLAKAGLLDRYDTKLLATDINTTVLEQCRQGVYTTKRLEPVPNAELTQYFQRIDNETYQVNQAIRDRAVFKRLNLAKPPFPMSGPLDIVFVRNVMIYFDTPTRTRLLDEVYRLLKPGGYLLVGHAESLTGLVSKFKTVRPSVYIKS